MMRKGPDPTWIEGSAERMLKDACVRTSELFFIGPRKREDPLKDWLAPCEWAAQLSCAVYSPMSKAVEGSSAGQKERRRQEGRTIQAARLSVDPM
jgi:hypothetical protein